MPGKRPTKADLALRLKQVEEWLCEHEQGESLTARIMKEWDVSERTARNYTAKVLDRWETEAIEDRPTRREAQRQRLFAIARRFQDDPGTLRWVENLLAKIDGTPAPERLEVFEFHAEDYTDVELERIRDGADPQAVLAARAPVH